MFFRSEVRPGRRSVGTLPRGLFVEPLVRKSQILPERALAYRYPKEGRAVAEMAKTTTHQQPSLLVMHLYFPHKIVPGLRGSQACCVCLSRNFARNVMHMHARVKVVSGSCRKRSRGRGLFPTNYVVVAYDSCYFFPVAYVFCSHMHTFIHLHKFICIHTGHKTPQQQNNEEVLHAWCALTASHPLLVFLCHIHCHPTINKKTPRPPSLSA